MKKQIVLAVLTMMAIVSIASITPTVFAAFNPHIPINQGTGIVNDKNGCRPPVQAGSVNIQMESGAIWAGAHCCASNNEVDPGVYTPNQCCNPPDFTGIFVPGNHCECFELRGYAPLP